MNGLRLDMRDAITKLVSGSAMDESCVDLASFKAQSLLCSDQLCAFREIPCINKKSSCNRHLTGLARGSVLKQGPASNGETISSPLVLSFTFQKACSLTKGL